MSQLSGEIATGGIVAAGRDMGQFLDMMLDPSMETRGDAAAADAGGPALAFAESDVPAAARLTQAFASFEERAARNAERRWSSWGTAYGSAGAMNGNARPGTADLSARSAGVAAGADYRLDGNTLVGFAISGASVNYGLARGLGSGQGEAFKAGLYASTRIGSFYLSASAAYGHYALTTSRKVPLTGFSGELTGRYGAHVLAGRLEAGYRFAVTSAIGITPFAAVQARSLWQPAYGETGTEGAGAFALSYGARRYDSLTSELGLRFDTRLAVTDQSILLLRGHLAWRHDYSGRPVSLATFDSLPQAAFTVYGTAAPRDALTASLSSEWRFGNGWSARAKVSGEISSGALSYGGSAGLRFVW